MILLLGLILLQLNAMPADTCYVKVDLINVKNDRVKVSVFPAKTPGPNAEYVMPAVIPGSYSQKDFGRFVNEFCAYDQKGKKLKVKRLGKNIFSIKKGEKLHRVEYWVDDTWDAPNENYIFQPGGTNIDQNRNFVINHQGFYGYFEGQKMNPYSIEYTCPPGHFPFSPLNMLSQGNIHRTAAADYVKLVDNPIMFCQPDTVSFQVANMRVYIGVFSENGYVSASVVKECVLPLAQALEKFFGKLPVDHYHFIMYFPKRAREGVTRYGGFGALEHSYSSFYFLPEMRDKAVLKDMIQSVAGHEFLHILTPLNIHSEEIEFFDFRNPKMSQHLWMYEGVTEYFAQLIRVKYGMLDEKGFMLEMTSKIENSDKYTDTSFTLMSKNILIEPFKKMYSNVYDKGALLAMLLDLHLLEKSEGKLGLREAMLLLAEKYGPARPFKDDELFTEIVQLSFPETMDFFERYIMGDEKLPYKPMFRLLGWEYYHQEEADFLSFGDFKLYPNRNNGQVMVLETESMKNKFGLKNYDIIKEINGIKLSPDMDSLMEVIEEPQHNTEIQLSIKRNGETLLIKARPEMKREKKNYYLRKGSKTSSEQELFRSWYFKP